MVQRLLLSPGGFSLVNDEQESLVAELAAEVFGADFPVTKSSEIGSIGIIERENAAILNSDIRKLTENAYSSFQNVLLEHNIKADLFITQNDGTLISIEYAKKYPVLTIASGPTNTLRGAAILTGMKEAIDADVGGTTTDVGVLTKGVVIRCRNRRSQNKFQNARPDNTGSRRRFRSKTAGRQSNSWPPVGRIQNTYRSKNIRRRDFNCH